MTEDELTAFIRQTVREVLGDELRKALDEEVRLQRVRAGLAPAYYPPRMETKELPAWARQEGGTAH